MAARSVLHAFEKFQKERTAFVITIGELAKGPQYIEPLERAGALVILKSMLLDSVPNIRYSAATALSRLASAEDRLAEAVVELETLPLLKRILSEPTNHHKKAAASCLRAIARHSPSLAQSVVNCGVVPLLVSCLEETDASVKEAAAWTLGYIASHDSCLAQDIVDAGCISKLVRCIQDTDPSVKRMAASALGDIAKHAADLAQLVVDAGAVPHIAALIMSQDTKLRRQVLACLGNIAKHSTAFAEIVIEEEIFPKVLTSLKFSDALVQKNAATLVREICKHTPEIAQLVVSHGSVGALVDHISETQGHFRLPSIMAIGFISAFSETLASTVIAENAVLPLVGAARSETEDVMKSVIVWTLAQIGKHTSEHAKSIAETGLLIDIVNFESLKSSSEDLKTKCRQSLKTLVAKLIYLPALDALLRKKLEEELMQIVIQQLSQALSHDPQGRAQFVHSGGLTLLQELAEAPDSMLKESIESINSQYPEEIVMHYSPSYSQKLLEKLDSQASEALKV